MKMSTLASKMLYTQIKIKIKDLTRASEVIRKRNEQLIETETHLKKENQTQKTEPRSLKLSAELANKEKMLKKYEEDVSMVEILQTKIKELELEVQYLKNISVKGTTAHI